MVRLYKVAFIGNDTQAPQLQDAGFYAPNQLYKTITKDENWKPAPTTTMMAQHTTEEFKNKQGQVLLKRTLTTKNGTTPTTSMTIMET